MHGAISRMGTLRADAPITAGQCPWERIDRRDLMGFSVMRGHDVVLSKDRSQRPIKLLFFINERHSNGCPGCCDAPIILGFDRTANH